MSITMQRMIYKNDLNHFHKVCNQYQNPDTLSKTMSFLYPSICLHGAFDVLEAIHNKGLNIRPIDYIAGIKFACRSGYLDLVKKMFRWYDNIFLEVIDDYPENIREYLYRRNVAGIQIACRVQNSRYNLNTHLGKLYLTRFFNVDYFRKPKVQDGSCLYRVQHF